MKAHDQNELRFLLNKWTMQGHRIGVLRAAKAFNIITYDESQILIAMVRVAEAGEEIEPREAER